MKKTKVEMKRRVVGARSSKVGSLRRRVLTIAPPEKSFWVHHGPVLRHLVDLRDCLGKISVEQFNYHTKRAGNDFAKWVEGVLNDAPCAKKLIAAATPAVALAAVRASLTDYQGPRA